MTGQACFIDLKKAFDTLNHKFVFHKLENYGFKRKINEILGSFLKDRKQHVRVNEIETDKLTNCPNRCTTRICSGTVSFPCIHQ